MRITAKKYRFVEDNGGCRIADGEISVCSGSRSVQDKSESIKAHLSTRHCQKCKGERNNHPGPKLHDYPQAPACIHLVASSKDGGNGQRRLGLIGVLLLG